VELDRQLGRQTRLADPRLAHDEDEPSGAAVRMPPLLAQRVELRLTAHQRGAGVQLRGQLGRGVAGRLELGVLAQDRLVQPAQLRPRLRPDRLHERSAEVAVGLQRVRLAAGAIEGEHPLGVQALSQRLLGRGRIDLPDDLAVPAVREIGVHGQLDCPQAQLLQAADLAAGERLVRDVGQRRAAPQRQRLARHPARDQLLEAVGVQATVSEAQLVPAPARDELPAVSPVRQGLAQLRDIQLDHLVGSGRWLLPPKALHEAVGRDGRAPVQRQQGQQGQQGARLARADGHRLAADADLHGSQDADLHLPASKRCCQPTVLPRPSADKPDLPRVDRRPTASAQPLGISSPVTPEEVTIKRRPYSRRLRAAVLALASCAALAAPAAAEPGSDYPQPSTAKIGDTPADFAQPVAPETKSGDTPVDHPGASRAIDYQQPTTIEIVRPERTIVRDVDELLPLVFSSVALLIVLGGGAFVLVGGIRRGRVERSH
jgi:hypothetical protein